MRTAPWTHALKSHGQRLAALLVPQPSAGVVRAFHRQSPAPGHTHPPAGDTGPEHLAQSGQKKGYSFLQLTYTSLKSCKERMSQDDKFPLGRCENGGSERESVSQTPLPGSYGRAGMKICDPDPSQPIAPPFSADYRHLWANDRSILSRGTSRSKGLESGLGVVELEGDKKA